MPVCFFFLVILSLVTASFLIKWLHIYTGWILQNYWIRWAKAEASFMLNISELSLVSGGGESNWHLLLTTPRALCRRLRLPCGERYNRSLFPAAVRRLIKGMSSWMNISYSPPSLCSHLWIFLYVLYIEFLFLYIFLKTNPSTITHLFPWCGVSKGFLSFNF